MLSISITRALTKLHTKYLLRLFHGVRKDGGVSLGCLSGVVIDVIVRNVVVTVVITVIVGNRGAVS